MAFLEFNGEIMSGQKQSQFTAKSRVGASDYFPVFGSGTNEKVLKSDLFQQIKDETQIFIYPTIELLQAADLIADPDFPIYVRVEETGYSLYKITSLAAGASDIELDNGTTASLQLESSRVGFVAKFSDLANTPVSEAGQEINTGGYSVAGIGANKYQSYAGSASIAGIHSASATAGFFWALVRNGDLHDVDVGSIPDNSTDNYVALNVGFAALTALAGVGNGILRLSCGTTKTSGSISIPPGCKLKGAGSGGNWATGDGVAHGTSPSYSSRLLYTGSASVNIILMADGTFDAGVEDLYIDGGRTVSQIQAWADAFNAPSTLPEIIIGIRSTSTLGARCKNVRIQNVTYGILFDSATTHPNSFGSYENILIQTCNIGILMAGIYNQSPVSNQGFANLKVTGYYNRGVDFRVAADSNLFNNVYLSTSIAPSVGVYYNSSSPGIDQGIGFNNIHNLICDLYNPAPGDNGMRSIVSGYTAPGYSYVTGFISPVTNNHYTMLPEILPNGLLFWGNAVTPSYTVTELGLWNGGAFTQGLSATYATVIGASNLFNANNWSSLYTTDAAVANFRRASKITRVEWVVTFNPGSALGGLQLYDSVGAVVLGSLVPGASGSVTRVLDVTNAFLSLARGAPAYPVSNDVLVTMRYVGDGITAPIVYRSYLRVVTNNIL